MKNVQLNTMRAATTSTNLRGSPQRCIKLKQELILDSHKPFVRNIALDLVLTLVTCGLFNFYVQYQQILAMNDILKKTKYDFFAWLFFCVITCGLYHIYHEYRISTDLATVLNKSEEKSAIISLLLTIFGFCFILDAIQQSEINRYYGNDAI